VDPSPIPALELKAPVPPAAAGAKSALVAGLQQQFLDFATSFQQQLTELKADNQLLKEDNKALKSDNQRLREENEELRVELKELRSENRDLKAANKLLLQRVDKLQKESKMLISEV
jgi:predicted nuclease with TOPRIM domain